MKLLFAIGVITGLSVWLLLMLLLADSFLELLVGVSLSDIVTDIVEQVKDKMEGADNEWAK